MERRFDKELHRRYLTNLLTSIAKAFPGKIAFKGGTCALFFYNLPRFSFDLDFDMLEPFPDEDVVRLRSILAREGRLLDWQDKRFTLLGVLDYGGGYPNIKIELNKRLWAANKSKSVLFLGVPLIIPDETTILTNKLIALTDRKTPVARDLYDVWYFLKMGFRVNPDLIKERTGKTTDELLQTTAKFVQKTFTPRNVLQGLGEALDDDQKQWAKRQLIEDTINMLNSFLGMSISKPKKH
jgi:predicted nucleotidyltransferase component of viral defense system